MKILKILSFTGVATMVLAVSACATHSQNVQKNVQKSAVEMANPASVFCVEQGGKLEIRKNADGSEYGMCHLPDGRVVEEWAFFRAAH